MQEETFTHVSHPSEPQLKAFAAGELSADVAAQLERHLVSCATCGSRFDALSLQGDPLVARLRVAKPTASADDTTSLRPASEEWTGIASPASGRRMSGEPSKDEFPAIGNYEMLEKIAQGGMGVVFKARHRKLDRIVALKRILSGELADAQDVERFYEEARAAANLRHPNIVAIHEIGEMEGQPFFAMDFIEGESLAAKLREKPMEGREAAELLAQVAAAVQYAHEQKIIHRDLKPANILVDRQGRPHVTDFGLAKRSDSQRELTVTGQVLGTPSYMPPEQASGELGQIGPASDVYALGAILYAMLIGRAPFAAANVSEVLRQVLGQEPVAPRQLNPDIDADLETICLKCLEKEPGRRYSSAQELVEELRRYLRQEPILARPVSAVEHGWRWCKRNPVIASLATCVALILITATGVAWYLASWAMGENDVAQRRLTEIERINDTVFGIFEDFDISKIKQGSAPVEAVLAERLAEAGRKLDSEAIHDPLVMAKLKNRLGMTLGSLGLSQDAEKLFNDAHEIYVEHLGRDHPETLMTMSNLAGAYHAAGDLQRAESLMEETFKAMQERLGSDHPTTLTCASNLATFYQDAGDLKRALRLYEETLRKRRESLGPDDPDTLITMNNLASAYLAARDLKNALPLFEETLRKRREKLGPSHHYTLVSMNNLALAYQDAGDLKHALPLCEETLRISQEKLGPYHPDTLAMMNTLAVVYRAGGDYKRALPLCEEGLQRTREKLGPDHPTTLTAMGNLASAYEVAGNLKQALPLFEEALQKRRKTLGPDHPDTLMSMNNLALAYQEASDFKRALSLHEEALSRSQKQFGSDHPDTLMSKNNLASAYQAAGDLERALPLFEETLRMSREKVGSDHPHTLATMNNLADAYQAAGDHKRALALYEECFTGRMAKLGTDHPDTVWTTNSLARAYKATGDSARALALDEKLLQAKQKKLGTDHPDTLTSMNNLALAYQAAGDFKHALPLFEETLQRKRTTLGPDDPSTLRSIFNVAFAYQVAGKSELALPLLEEFLKLRRKRLQAGLPDAGVTINNLAALCRKLGQEDEANALAWRLQDGVVSQFVADKGDRLLTFGSADWKDYDIELEAKLDQDGGEFGICLHVQSDNMAIACFGGFNNSAHVLLRKQKDGIGVAGEKVAGKLESGKWYKARIEVRGEEITALLDGKKLYTQKIAGLDHGKVGLRTQATTAQFRSLRITDKDGKVIQDGFAVLSSR